MTAILSRLHLATRIHFALMRALGERIDIGRMLRQRPYADEVLRACRALHDAGLADLAERFEALSAADDARIHMAHAAEAARAALAQLPRRGAPPSGLGRLSGSH